MSYNNFSRFEPSEGYIIMSHGKDGDKFITVPNNCIVVVKYRPGEIATSTFMYDLLNRVGDPINATTFLDPLHNLKSVANLVEDVLIFKPGDKCPNFIYTFYFNEDNFILDYTTGHMGLFTIPLERKITLIENEGETLLQDKFNEMYEGSILPKKEDVIQSSIEEFMKAFEHFYPDDPITPEQLDMDHITDYILRVAGPIYNRARKGDPDAEYIYKELSIQKLMRKFSYTQWDLFQVDESGVAQRPGVYYNFVCRQKKGLEAYGKAQDFEDIFNAYNIKNVRKTPRSIRWPLLRRISEAEQYRKPIVRLMDKLKEKKGGGRHTRRQRRRVRRTMKRKYSA